MDEMKENTVSVETTNNSDDEISLIDLFAVLWKRKWMIIGITAVAMVAVVIYSVISLKLPSEKSFMPNVYTPQAQMLINNKDGGNSMSSMLSASGLGGLASLAGVNVGGGASNSALASYLVYSNTILDAVVNKFNLIERYKIEKFPIASSRDALKEVLKTNFDDKTGVFTVSFKDTDPAFARDVINYVVDLLEKRFYEMGIDQNQLTKDNLEDNIRHSYDEILKLQMQIQELEMSVSNGYNPNGIPSIVMDTSLLKMELTVQEQIYAGLKTQYESLKVTMASEQPVFQILEYAEIPDRKSGPSRGKLCIIVTFAAGFLSVFLAFLLNALENLRKDPVAMAKLKGKK